MKKYFILLFSISIGIVTSCQNQKATTKPQKSVEVKVEKNDSVSKAKVTITSNVNGKVSKEVQMFEGTTKLKAAASAAELQNSMRR